MKKEVFNFKTAAGGYLQTSVKEKYEMSKDKPTLPEQALGRLFMFRGDSSSIREFDLERLLEWQKVGSCRYAVEAIVSLVLGDWRPLSEKAQEWIAAQEDKSLILAVALIRAKRTKEIQAQVKDRIFAYHRLTQTEEVQALFFKMDDGEDVSWDEIREAVGLSNYEIMPPTNRPDLFAHCWRVMVDPCHIGETLATIREIVTSTDLSDKPFLRRWIVESTLSVNTEEILGILQEHFSLFAEEIISVLTTDELPGRKIFSGKESQDQTDDTRFFQNFFKLAQFFASNLSSLKKRQRQQFIQRLFKAKDNPWIWYIAAELCEQNKGSWRLVPNFLVSWFFVILRDHTSLCSTKWKDLSWDNIRETTKDNKFATTIILVPDDSMRRFARLLISERLVNRFLQDMSSGFSRVIQEVKNKVFVVLEVVEKEVLKTDEICFGLLSDRGILDYLELVGFERGKNVLIQWLRKYQGGYRIGIYNEPEEHKLLVEYVIPNNLSAGRLLVPGNVKGLLKLGYQLKPEDISSEQDVIGIVFQGAAKLTRYVSFPDLWNNQSWRQVLFASGYAHNWIVHSLLITAYEDVNSKERLDWLETILIPECEKQEEFRKALCLVAWEESPRRADVGVRLPTELARLLLIKDGRWQRWMDKEERIALFESYCNSNWSRLLTYEREIVQTLLNPDNILDLFFRKIYEEVSRRVRSNETTLGIQEIRPQNVTYLFEEIKAKKRLANWLLAHRDKIDLESCMEWIREFGLVSIDNKIRRWVVNTLDKGGKEADLALEIIQAA